MSNIIEKRTAELKALTLLDGSQVEGEMSGKENPGRFSYLREIYEFDLANLDINKLFGGQIFSVPAK